MNIAEQLAAMFEADRNVSAREWFEQFPMYKIDAALDLHPAYPPSSEVWFRQGEPGTDGAPCHSRTAPVWDYLQRLHAEYCQQKAKAEVNNSGGDHDATR